LFYSAPCFGPVCFLFFYIFCLFLSDFVFSLPCNGHRLLPPGFAALAPEAV
jgi:hypothetical protein